MLATVGETHLRSPGPALRGHKFSGEKRQMFQKLHIKEQADLHRPGGARSPGKHERSQFSVVKRASRRWQDTRSQRMTTRNLDGTLFMRPALL